MVWEKVQEVKDRDATRKLFGGKIESSGHSTGRNFLSGAEIRAVWWPGKAVGELADAHPTHHAFGHAA